MKRVIKRLLCTIVAISLLVGAILAVSDVLKPMFIGDVYNTIDAFYGIPDNSVDVMVYGSSHAWKGFDAGELEKNFGVSAYNYGGNWQYINTTALFLEDSLISQSPKVVLIESFLVNSVHINTKLNGEIMYTNHLRWSEAKWQYMKTVFGKQEKEYLSYYFPIIYFHGNWKDLQQWNFMNPTDDYDYAAARGYLANYAVQPVTVPDYTTFKQESLSDEAKAVLDRIVSVCKERGIQVVFYTAPWGGEYQYSDAMHAFAEENGCHYVDCFEKAAEAGLDGETDFQDVGHLNDSGAKKIANYLGEYLKENQLL